MKLLEFSSINLFSIGFKNLWAIGKLKKFTISFKIEGVFFINKIVLIVRVIKKIFLMYFIINIFIVLFFLKDFLFSKNFINSPVVSVMYDFLLSSFKLIKILFFLNDRVKKYKLGVLCKLFILIRENKL